MKMKKLLIGLFPFFAAVQLLSCGSSLKTAQDFKPNKPPVLESINAVMSDGSQIATTAIVTGQKFFVTVKAYDPEAKPLTYSVTSDFGTVSDESVTSDGYTFVMTSIDITTGVNFKFSITIEDQKKATTAASFDIGTGRIGATLSLAPASETPINATGNIDTVLTSNAEGYFQIFCDNKSQTVTSMKPGGQFPFEAETDGSFKTRSLKVSGLAYALSDSLVRLTSEGENRIWVVFRDANGFITSVKCSVVLDTTKPVLTPYPADNASAISVSAKIKLQFNEDVDGSCGTLTLMKSGDVKNVNITYNASESGSRIFVYEHDTLEKSGTTNIKYFISAAGFKDLAGNIMDARTYCFYTAHCYSVTFNSNGGTSIPNQDLEETNLIVRPDDPSLTGYTFGGWYKDSGLITAWDFTSDKVMSDVTLYAKWNINSYTVTFDTQGGSSVPPQNISYSSLAAKPADPANGIYTFRGWYKDTSYTTEWNFSSDTVTQNTTIYARWGLKCKLSFSVTGNTGGTVPSPVYYFYGEPVTLNSFNSSNGNLIKQEATKASRIAKWTDGTNTYNEGDAVYLGSSDSTLTGIWEEYKVGDPGPAGGWIFYVASSYTTTSFTESSVNYSQTWKYLEVSPTDVTSSQWMLDGKGTYNFVSTATGFGEGFHNTIKIINYTGNGYAAQRCYTYSVSGYSSGWFLPSYDELQEVYTNVGSKITSGTYWSSSTNGCYIGWAKDFSVGTWYSGMINCSGSSTGSYYPSKAIHGF